jgi:hypothetical protein
MKRSKTNTRGKNSSLWKKYRSWHEPVLLRPFRPDKKDKTTKTPAFATIDIETQDWVNFVCGEVYWIDKSGREQFFESDCLHTLMLKCFEIAAHEDIKNFVAHYGGKFDFLFFIKELMLSGLATLENIIPRGASLLCFDAVFNPSSSRVNFPLPPRITFRDSSALLPFSLGSLTKSFNVETLKGEMDFLFVEQVYKGVDYLEDIIAHDKCALFFNKRQIFSITKNMRQRDGLRYWNLERFNLFPYRGGKISPVFRYMVKRNKKGEIVENDWFYNTTYPIFKKSDLLTYLHHDCKSLHQVITAFFNAPLICSSKKKWTTASQAVETFRLFMKDNLHSLPDDDIFYHEGDVDGFVRMAYFGGRTEIFKPIFDSEINDSDYLFYQDINSLYPFVMSKFDYPNKFIGWISGEKEYLEYDMAIWHCKVRVPENMYAPPLPIKSDGRLIFPVGEFKGYWTRYELDYAKKLGCEILEYYEGAAFENAGMIFKNFIETLYGMRLEAKEKNDNVTQMTMKLLMNSCYGRMGINKDRSKIVIDDGTFNNIKLIAEIEISEKSSIRLSEKPERSRTMFSNPAIACFVTSYARVFLHENMREVGERSVYYCDTDSLFTDRPMKLGKELGAMKLEYKCKSACFLLPKTYVNEDIIEEDGQSKPIKLTMKGFDYKNIRNAFTVEDFLSYLHGDIGNISVVEKPKFATFKTALRMGEFVTMKNDPSINRMVDERREQDHEKRTGKKKKYIKKEYKVSVKKLQGYYMKRKITKGGFDTEPLRIYD